MQIITLTLRFTGFLEYWKMNEAVLLPTGFVNLILICYALTITDEDSDEKLILINICITEICYLLCFVGLPRMFLSIVVDGSYDLQMLNVMFLFELCVCVVIFTLYIYTQLLTNLVCKRSTMQILIVASWIFSISFGAFNGAFPDRELPFILMFVIVGVQIVITVIAILRIMLSKLRSPQKLHVTAVQI